MKKGPRKCRWEDKSTRVPVHGSHKDNQHLEDEMIANIFLNIKITKMSISLLNRKRTLGTLLIASFIKIV